MYVLWVVVLQLYICKYFVIISHLDVLNLYYQLAIHVLFCYQLVLLRSRFYQTFGVRIFTEEQIDQFSYDLNSGLTSLCETGFAF